MFSENFVGKLALLSDFHPSIHPFIHSCAISSELFPPTAMRLSSLLLLLLLHVPIFFIFVFVAISSHSRVQALDNGLVKTPPMGWMSWAKFYCETDCQRHPFSCINEQLYKDMADRMAEDGFLDAGYEYVHIDDCWMDWKRDAKGQLMANHTRFPSGIPALADYIHSKGLKFGIYEDIGTLTCAGYPGSWEHFQADAKTFADWHVDYLKLDGCNLNTTLMPEGYIDMGMQLNKSGRPIVYSCSWPAYLDFDHEEAINYPAIGEHCNLWRNYADIGRSWGSVMGIINFYVRNQDQFRAAQGPGKWNDPDMIIVGNTELSLEQAKVQMAIWSIWSAPLIMSNDLRTIFPEYRAVLLNKRVIAVDQDPLGVMGKLVYKGTQTYVFVKEMTPADPGRKLFSYAVAVLNYGFLPIHFATDLKSIGLTFSSGYSLQDLWSGKQLGHFTPNDVYNVTLAATSVSMFKATLATNTFLGL